MAERILVTGGAGFIGSHLVDALVTAGYTVRVLDALVPQVHPRGRPAYLNPEAELQEGDVRRIEPVWAALDGVDVVVHFAAAVGVEQSMTDIAHYASTNTVGMAMLLDAITRMEHRPRRLVVASSMSIYGEGAYRCGRCGPREAPPRSIAQIAAREWALRCPSCQAELEPRPTSESKRPAPASIYALGKWDQEAMALMIGARLGMPVDALRFFGVYGPRQALTNPYTGVGAIFSSALLAGRRPTVFEDGEQLRDFIHVSDVVAACVRAIQVPDVPSRILNIGTGVPTTVAMLARMLAQAIPGAGHLEPEIVGTARHGDIRACYADTRLARSLLGWEAKVPMVGGVMELAAWAAEQRELTGRAG